MDKWRRKYAWLDHIMLAYERFTERYGTHYAAAVTYFSVLSLVPILMIGFAIAGFVLQSQPDLLAELRGAITEAVPDPNLSKQLNDAVTTALESKGTVGIIGLIGAAYSGLGWMGNLRDALTAQWGHAKENLPFLGTLWRDLLALVGLGLAIVLSFGITALGTGFAELILRWMGLENSRLGARPAADRHDHPVAARELARVPVGALAAAAQARRVAQRDPRGVRRSGRVRGPEADGDDLPVVHDQVADLGRVRVRHRCARVREPRGAVRPVHHGLDGHREGEPRARGREGAPARGDRARGLGAVRTFAVVDARQPARWPVRCSASGGAASSVQNENGPSASALGPSSQVSQTPCAACAA